MSLIQWVTLVAQEVLVAAHPVKQVVAHPVKQVVQVPQQAVAQAMEQEVVALVPVKQVVQVPQQAVEVEMAPVVAADPLAEDKQVVLVRLQEALQETVLVAVVALPLEIPLVQLQVQQARQVQPVQAVPREITTREHPVLKVA